MNLSRVLNEVRSCARKETLSSIVSKHDDKYQLRVTATTREFIDVKTFGTCRALPHVPIKVNAAGARTQTHVGQHDRWLHISVCSRSDDHDCMRADNVNAVHVLYRGDTKTLFSPGSIRDELFGTVRTWMQRCFSRYSLCHWKSGTLRPDYWIMQQSGELFLLIITCEDSYEDDHENVVVIDSACREIID